MIAGVRAQTTPVADVVAVDTGSKDESADLLEKTDQSGVTRRDDLAIDLQ